MAVNMAVKDLLWANSEVVITNTAAAPALQRPGAARTPASRRNVSSTSSTFPLSHYYPWIFGFYSNC